MVDIKFIARQAGVSIATVSRVLNKSKPVSKELEKKVLDAIIKYQYYPNPHARLLVNKRSFLIGILVEEPINAFQAFVLPMIAKAIEQQGYQGVIHIVGGNFEEKQATIEALAAKQIDALISLFSLEEMQWKRIKSLISIPIISADLEMKHPTIFSMNYEAAYLATRYLVSMGHQKIGGLFYNAGPTHRFLNERYEGFRDALQDTIGKAADEYCMHGTIGIDKPASMIGQFMQRKTRPTAIFCESDELAIGAMYYLQKNRIMVPEDISIIGYDGILMGSQVEPRLTTVAYPYDFWISFFVKNLICEVEKKPMQELSEADIRKHAPYIIQGESVLSIK